MSKAVFGTVPDGTKLELVLNRLQGAGFPNSAVSVLFPEKGETYHFAMEKHSKAPEGAATGAGTGGVVGGVLGWLVGIGSLAIPGIGPFVAAGPILAALSGAAVGAATGGVIGSLVGLGIPEIEAKEYEAKLKAGHALVSVHAENSEQAKRARDIFKDCGAEHISETKDLAA